MMILFTILLCFRLGSAFPRYFDNIPLKEVAMIYSHDAATGYMKEATGIWGKKVAWAKTVDGSFSRQAYMGVRAWDVRPHVASNGKMYWHHGDVEVRDITFEAGVDELIEWLSKHPTEVFVMNWFSCTGDNCFNRMKQVLAAKGAPMVEKGAGGCDIFDTITVGEARKKWGLKSGGTMISTDNCILPNYKKSEANVCHYKKVGVKSQVGVMRSCYDDDWSSHKNDPTTKWTAYMNEAINTDTVYQNGLTSVQAHWNTDTDSIVMGIVRGSSLAKDSEKSGVNKQILKKMDGWEDNVKIVGVDFVNENGDELYNRLTKINYKRATLWDCHVQLYPEPNFQGKSTMLPLGTWRKRSDKGHDHRSGFNFMSGRPVRSVKVSEGCQAVLMQFPNYPEQTKWQSKFEGSHSSVQVYAARVDVVKTAGCKVHLYAGADFSGSWWQGHIYTFKLGGHSLLKLPNNSKQTFQSIRIVSTGSASGGCKAEFRNKHSSSMGVLTEGDYTLAQLKAHKIHPHHAGQVTLSPRAPVEYTMINVAQTCQDLGLEPIDTPTECIWAAESIELGPKTAAINNWNTNRPAGCSVYDPHNKGNPQLEFNPNVLSTWRSNEWMDLYQFCKRTPTVTRHDVSQTCQKRGLRPINSVDHCEWAMGQIGYKKGTMGGIPKVSTRHNTDVRPAGCIEYTGHAWHDNSSFLEFNFKDSSKWTNSGVKDMFHVCQDRKETRCKYPGRYAGGLVNGDSTKRNLDESMKKCKGIYECQAVTCNSAGEDCTLRRHGRVQDLNHSPTKEITFRECTGPVMSVRRLEAELPAPVAAAKRPIFKRLDEIMWSVFEPATTTTAAPATTTTTAAPATTTTAAPATTTTTAAPSQRK